jgi:NTP pyrophosphatase (non-canonical NTP hydrolase)
MSAQVSYWFTDTQDKIGKWAKHNFPDSDRVCTVGAVTEEAAEMLRAARKQSQKIRGTYEEWDKELQKEAGDTLIALFQAAEHCGFDLLDAFCIRWYEVSRRDFQQDAVGHGLPKEE